MKPTLIRLAALALFCTLHQANSQSVTPNNGIELPPLYGTLTPPAKGAAYQDPVFGTKVTRISNALGTPNADGGGTLTWIENEYSTASPFNLDNSRLILVHQSYFGLYDGAGPFLGNLPLEINSGSEPRWSRKDAGILYYHSGNQLKTYNVTTAANKVVHTFSEYGSINGNGEMDISQDGDHLVFGGDGRYVFLYTISSDIKSAVFDAEGHAFDSLYVTPDNHVTITWTESGVDRRYSGIEMFDSNMKFVRQLAHAGGHMHMGRDVNGDEVLIWPNSNDPKPACGHNAIVKIRLADAVHTCLLSLDWSLAVHISAADSTWAFVETYSSVDLTPQSGWSAYTGELLQIKLDGSEVRRLTHHRSRPFGGYLSQPKLSVSRDGTRLVYSSNFSLQTISGAPASYSDEYMMVLDGSATVTTPVKTTGPVTTSITSVVNSASYQTALAPGSIVSFFGTGFADSTLTAASGSWPTSLGSLNVYFNGVAAPLSYASGTQINAQVPYGLPAGPVNIELDGLTVARQTVTISPAAPGVFSKGPQGTGEGSILHGDTYAAVNASAPASAGQVVLIYCTGLGELSSSVTSGSSASSPASTALLPVVTIGGVSASVAYSGLAAGYPGLYQVNVQVPAGVAPGGAVPVVITSGGLSSNTVTMAVQ